MLDKLRCFITVSLWKSPCYRLSILNGLQKLLVHVGQLFNILKEKFIKDILLILPAEGIKI